MKKMGKAVKGKKVAMKKKAYAMAEKAEPKSMKAKEMKNGMAMMKKMGKKK
jgi:hypothetical protein